MKRFPVIDPVATGRNINRLRREKGLSVRDVQQWFGFEEPQAIYKWQQGRSLPSVDNLYALCALLEVSMEELLVEQTEEDNEEEQQDESCCPLFFIGLAQKKNTTEPETPPERGVILRRDPTPDSAVPSPIVL